MSQNQTYKLQQLQYVLEEIKATNTSYVSKEQTHLESFAKSQHPVATLVMCCDSRAHTTSFTANPENHFFIVRNIGNQYILNQGSIEFGVRNLGTPLLIFLGHTQCGAIQASMGNYSSQSSAIIREVDHLALSIKLHELTGSHESKYYQAVENNINKQVELATKDFQDLIKQDKLIILGMILDIDNAKNGGYGKIYLINYQGETNQDILQNIPEINKFL